MPRFAAAKLHLIWQITKILAIFLRKNAFFMTFTALFHAKTSEKQSFIVLLSHSSAIAAPLHSNKDSTSHTRCDDNHSAIPALRAEAS